MLDKRSTDPPVCVRFSTVPDLLAQHAERSPNALAILAPGRAPLTYGGLHRHVEQTGRALRNMGLGRADRVAVVLPNGAETAAAILAVAACAACASVNPAYGDEELDRYFAGLNPAAVIVPAGADVPARRVAVARGIPLIEISTAPDAEAGLFTLAGPRKAAPAHAPASPEDVALLLFTSGTMAQPKIVPLTHANLCASAASSGAALALSDNDRCLNVLPLFHGHGLIATVLTSLAAGASVVCTAGCDTRKFFGWVSEFRPSWYSAVPTMHQAILAQARLDGIKGVEHRLRLVRSASAPLPPRVFAELEQVFAAPVIEFYGMTETASAPIGCNPLPPRQRKAGSVGPPVGLDVAIIGEDGTLLPRRQTGQVVVRGASVMRGYAEEPAASTAAFAGDWFETGDQGFYDDDGYLFLVGRAREMINRGGENIAPREVEELLLEHSAVAEAVVFAIPHPTLGEDVAAAIVLRRGTGATPEDIRQSIRGRIADFKVPRQVLVVTAIPKSSTGKVRRVEMAAKLGFPRSAAAAPAFVAPRTPIEKALADRWAEILQVRQIGIHDDFFALGGDSLLAACVLIEIQNTFGTTVEIAQFFEAPTVSRVADEIATLIRSGQPRSSSAIPRLARSDRVRASIAQERLCRLQNAVPGLPFFNILYALRLSSPFDRTILERSINALVQRHEILRTTFAAVDDGYVQVIATHVTVPLQFDDLGGLPDAERATIAHRLVQDEALHSFDLAQGPLLRARLVYLAEPQHLLLFTLHQVIGDGWSMGVLIEELAALYKAFSAGEDSPLAPLPIQFADFAYWQRDWLSHPDIVSQLAYWRAQLRDPLPALRFPAMCPKQRLDDFRTARRKVNFPASLTDALKAFSSREGGTLFMALVAGLKILLRRRLAQDDLRVATLIANRNRPGVEGLIGPLVNTLILRTILDGDPTPREVMRQVRATTVAAFANQDLPFEALVDTLARERSVDPAALAPVMLWVQNAALRPVASSGQTLGFEEANPNALLPLVTLTGFDVTVMLRESAGGLGGCCVYKPHRFDPPAIDRLLREFQGVLENMVMEPERPLSGILVVPE